VTPSRAKGIAAVSCAGLALAGAVVVAAGAVDARWAVARDLWLARASGWIALGALGLAVVMSPIARVAPRRIPGALFPALRRAFGITSASAALVHATLAVAGYLKGSLAAVTELPHLRSGLVALAILSALLVTSFPPIVTALRFRPWKELHRLAYVAAFFVLLHTLSSPFGSRTVVLTFFGVLIVSGMLRLVPKR